LVVPRLVPAGWQVAVADPVPELADRLEADRAYSLRVVNDGKAEDVRIAIAASLVPERDRAALGRRLATARLITTAVRRENLAAVARYLVEGWRTWGMPDDVTLVGCENVENVDIVLRVALRDAGAEPAMMQRVHVPATVVDRICAAAWPRGTLVTTEPYSELAIDEAAVPGSVPGVDRVGDIAARFDRKRYLVNTLADASAIIGVRSGYETLAEAIADPAIQDRIAPLVGALIDYLALRYGFERSDLALYLATSRRRLANRGIPRRLDTVARDLWRKFTPHERFITPLRALAERNALDDAALAVLADLISESAAIDAMPQEADAIRRRVMALAGRSPEPPVSDFYRRVADRIG
jgi:mannitol-1-phosphate 5-dehydrogenase